MVGQVQAGTEQILYRPLRGKACASEGLDVQIAVENGMGLRI